MGVYGPFAVDVFDSNKNKTVRLFSRESRRLRIKKAWDSRMSEHSSNVISIFDHNQLLDND